MVGLKGEFSGDFLERVLRIGKAELMAEKSGLGRSAIGGSWGSYVVQRRFDVLLGLLYEVGDIEHDFEKAHGGTAEWAIW
jgi:hypothetical protein